MSFSSLSSSSLPFLTAASWSGTRWLSAVNTSGNMGMIAVRDTLTTLYRDSIAAYRTLLSTSFRQFSMGLTNSFMYCSVSLPIPMLTAAMANNPPLFLFVSLDMTNCRSSTESSFWICFTFLAALNSKTILKVHRPV